MPQVALFFGMQNPSARLAFWAAADVFVNSALAMGPRALRFSGVGGLRLSARAQVSGPAVGIFAPKNSRGLKCRVSRRRVVAGGARRIF